jgi:NAD(P)H-flavin reductase/hemoglobin-like flavoprotein
VVDAQRLQKSWSTVAAHGDQVPLFFYSTLFLTHPYTREMFPVSMANQRDKLVGALGQVISRVDDLDSVVPILQQLGRDHRKFGVVREHYPAVGEALLATLEHFTGPEWTADLAQDWASAYGIVADVMVGAADDAATLPPWWDLTVTHVERRALGVTVLTVVPHTPIPYAAGQSIALEVPMRPRLWRYYTPATLPGPDGSFELHVRLVPGGPVSSALVQSARPGDVLRAGAPIGNQLTLTHDARGDVLMLAGGTGLAPMKALIHQLDAQGERRQVHLYWGTRFARELYDLPAMHRLAEQLDWLRLVPCVSHEQIVGAHVAPGTAVEVALREGPWPEHEVYICGSPEMVRATLSAVQHAGTADHRVHVEQFGSEETAI